MINVTKSHPIWNEVYTILVETCGAIERDREHFLQSAGSFSEWRFQGMLGFGGKFWANNCRLYVSYYPEDRTAERDEIVREANGLIDRLISSYEEL